MPFFVRRPSRLTWLLPIGFALGLTIGRFLVQNYLLNEPGTTKLFLIVATGAFCSVLLYVIGLQFNYLIIDFHKDEVRKSYSEIIQALVEKRGSSSNPKLKDILMEPDLVDKRAWKSVLKKARVKRKSGDV